MPEWVTPTVSIAVVVIGGAWALWAKLVEGRSAKMPTVAQIWERMDGFEDKLEEERAARQTLRAIFLAYVQRVQTGGTSDLTDQERRQLFADDQPTEKVATP